MGVGLGETMVINLTGLGGTWQWQKWNMAEVDLQGSPGDEDGREDTRG